MELVSVAGIGPALRSAKNWRAAGTRQEAGLVLTRMVHALMNPKNR